MNHIIETKEIEIDGLKYIETTWSKGHVVRTLKFDPIEEIEPSEPEPTQLDRIEETVNNIATNSTSWDAMAQAISEGVNEV